MKGIIYAIIILLIAFAVFGSIGISNQVSDCENRGGVAVQTNEGTVCFDKDAIK